MEEKIVGILLEMQKDIADLKQEVSTIKPELREEIKQSTEALRKELRAEIRQSNEALKEELRAEIRQGDENVKTELKAEIQELKNQRYIDSHNIAKILENQIELSKKIEKIMVVQ